MKSENTIHLAKDCFLPIELLSLRVVEYGNSGAGKTALGRVLFEESVNAGVPTGVIDLKGDWWGLKSSKSGLSDGLPVIIFGGDHADVPINENAGAEIAEIVVELGHNFVIDLEYFSKAKQLKLIDGKPALTLILRFRNRREWGYHMPTGWMSHVMWWKNNCE